MDILSVHYNMILPTISYHIDAKSLNKQLNIMK
jgi:hypothetical protein